MMVWAGFIWLGIGTGGISYKQLNKLERELQISHLNKRYTAGVFLITRGTNYFLQMLCAPVSSLS
jgi:pantothenate kinase